MLVVPARKRRAELLLNLAGIDAVWGKAPTVEEIRVLDQQRMMQDALFTEAPSEDDQSLARALLAERSPEDIAAALARLFRSRFPAPEDILDPGEARRDRDERGPRRDERITRGDGTQKQSRGMTGGVWFRAGIGRKKTAEARWLLPMICRRGGIGKSDIGAIRIFEHATEFEISAGAAEEFAAKIRRPDKEDNIRIEALPDGPQGDAAPKHGKSDFKGNPGDRSSYGGKPRHEAKPRYNEKPRYEDKPRRDEKPRHDDAPPLRKKPKHGAGKPAFAKPDFKKKPKKNKHRN
jgi:ATP-dependent RNA helicase DeaD